MTDAFYRRTDVTTTADGEVLETFASSHHTASPWGADLQHGGPIAGLLVRAMERLEPRERTRITRVCVDILGPLPVTDVRVGARILRPGRRVEQLAATLEAKAADGSWRPAARATAWRLATQPTGDVVRHASAPLPPRADDVGGLSAFPIPDTWYPGGFVAAATWDAIHLGTEPGEASTAWVNLAVALVAGEETSGLCQLIAIADAANGLGARLDAARFSFLNTDLTLQVHDEPVGPWFGMAAETSIGADGVGMADAVLHGPDGPLGRVTQNLLVERRPDA
ncbi:thioesterase family protein [Aeromicrobium sp. Sec7.5]|uniref:thioesterase family protein n=1 Tax=Aeromicrobium sp. Sec7.5 TaxID=3121276 RepID=UPI002FE45DEA